MTMFLQEVNKISSMPGINLVDLKKEKYIERVIELEKNDRKMS